LAPSVTADIVLAHHQTALAIRTGDHPGPGEVIARPAYVGVCGTDLELLDGVVDPAYVRSPLVPGHEWSGVIEAVGRA
jgi:D-arabinose 1-dehydrogenase-like Zn-dependent alcohol dehydrogenase